MSSSPAFQPLAEPPGQPRPGPSSASGAAAGASKKLRRAAVIAALFVVIGVPAGLLPRWHRQAALAVTTRELAIQTVSVVSPALGEPSATLVLPAEIRPFAEAPIYARANGYLKRWLVDIGAHVNEGDLLAEIDTPELNQELAQGRAQLAQSQAALALAKTTAARWTELVKTASVSEQENAEKQADLDLRVANVEAARANVVRLEELQGFEKVKAPFEGTITARGIDIGQLISPNSTRELFHLVQTRTLRVFVHVPQAATRGLSPGQVAELTLPEISDKVFPAKLVRTAGAVSTDSRTLLAELEVDNPKHEILPGSFAQIRFPETNLRRPLTLPSNTLLFRPEGPQVGVVAGDGKVALRAIQLGRDFGPTVEILGGVGTNDQVILNPPDSLVAGTSVRIAADAEKRPARE